MFIFYKRREVTSAMMFAAINLIQVFFPLLAARYIAQLWLSLLFIEAIEIVGEYRANKINPQINTATWLLGLTKRLLPFIALLGCTIAIALIHLYPGWNLASAKIIVLLADKFTQFALLYLALRAASDGFHAILGWITTPVRHAPYSYLLLNSLMNALLTGGLVFAMSVLLTNPAALPFGFALSAGLSSVITLIKLREQRQQTGVAMQGARLDIMTKRARVVPFDVKKPGNVVIVPATSRLLPDQDSQRNDMKCHY